MWTRIPAVVERIFPQILWRMPAATRAVYLTFDDGPDPTWTPEILRILGEHQARATFFVVGEKADLYPELVRAAAAAGHSIGSHACQHRSLLFASRHHIHDQLDQADAAIAAAAGFAPRLFRPPYGRFGPAMLAATRDCGKQLVLWQVDSRDYSSRSTPAAIVRRVLRHLQPGTIILLHDGHQRSATTVTALSELLPLLTVRGYRCLPLSQMVTGRKATRVAELTRFGLAHLAFHGMSKQSPVAA